MSFRPSRPWFSAPLYTGLLPAALDKAAQLFTCEAAETNCRTTFEFTSNDKLLQFSGKPPSAWEVEQALTAA